MAALAAASRVLHLRALLPTWARIRRRARVSHAPAAAAWALIGPAAAPPHRRLVSCCLGGREENAVKKRVGSSLDEPLAYCRDDKDVTLESIKSNYVDEFAHVSFEEESGNGGSRINESIAQDVEKTSIELLAGRAFTVAELRKKLRSKKYPVDTVDAVIADIKARGLLNDGLYAETFSRSRWLSSTWGPRRIKQALRQKGVAEVEVDRATKRVFQDDDGSPDDCGHQTRYGISEASFDHLFCQASKQWHHRQSLPLENRRARIVRWLQYRGFNWAVTNAIIRRLESQNPP